MSRLVKSNTHHTLAFKQSTCTIRFFNQRTKPVSSFISDPFSDIDFAIAKLNHTQAVLNMINQCRDLSNQIPAKTLTSNDTRLQTETQLNNQSAQNQTAVFNAVNHLENVQRPTRLLKLTVIWCSPSN